MIPARGGSVGIPRKAVRPLAGIPPLVRTIQTARQVEASVAVITNDVDIATLAAPAGAVVVSEAPHTGDWPLDAAVYQAVREMEGTQRSYDLVVTMQCTSPFTSPELVRQCIEAAVEHDSALTVRDDRALRWHASPGPHLSLRAPYRQVRQSMPPCWRETGAVLATQRKYVTHTYRFGFTTCLVPVSGAEAIDLDTPEDWALAEWYAGLTDRELLLARVLVPCQRQGTAVMLSAWDEGREEQARRVQMAAAFPNAVALCAANTHDEAVRAVTTRGTDDLILVTSAYHLPRAFLTFLQVLQDHALDRTVRLWTAPAPSRMEKLAGEWQKVRVYQAKGHVASVEDGLAYLDWRDTCGT